MDKKLYKSKPQHLVTNAKTGEIVRIVHPSDTDVGSSQIGANLRVFSDVAATGNAAVTGSLSVQNTGSFANSAVVTGSLWVTNNVIVTGSLWVQNNVAVTGSLSVQNTGSFASVIQVTGSAYLPDLRSPVTALLFGHRLSLSSSNSLPSADVPSGSTLYLTNHTSAYLSLYNNNTWKVHSSSVVSLGLSSLTTDKNYDVFVYDNSGTLTLELVVWTSDSARATELATQDGVYVKSGQSTRRYVGTIRTQATNSTADSSSKRFVWNYYNQVPRHLTVTDTTVSWTYGSTTTWRQARASTANKVEYVAGLTLPLEASCMAMITNTVASHTRVGIGVNSTTVNSAQLALGFVATAGIVTFSMAQLRAILTAGYYAVNWLEWTENATATFYGQSTLRDPGLLCVVNG